MSGKSLARKGVGMGFHEAAGQGIELCGVPLNLIQPDKGNHTAAAREPPPHQPVSKGEGKVGSHEHHLLVIEGQRAATEATARHLRGHRKQSAGEMWGRHWNQCLVTPALHPRAWWAGAWSEVGLPSCGSSADQGLLSAPPPLFLGPSTWLGTTGSEVGQERAV